MQSEFKGDAMELPGDSPLMVEVWENEDAAPVQVQAILQTQEDNMAILAIHSSRMRMDWETLPGKKVQLYPGAMAPPGFPGVEGTVFMVQRPVTEDEPLIVGVELVEQFLALDIDPQSSMPQGYRDVRDLWGRWDEVRQEPTALLPFLRPYSIGLLMIMAGFALVAAGGKSYAVLSTVCLLAGSLALTVKMVAAIWRERSRAH